MTSEDISATDPRHGPDEAVATRVQLLVADPGNRQAIAAMLGDHFQVDTSREVGEAALYLVEDRLFAQYRQALTERVESEAPVFCPVVVLRRPGTTLPDRVGTPGDSNPLLVDGIVDAPVESDSILRQVHSLLVRRNQSRQLKEYVTRVEEREQRLRRYERAVADTDNAIAITDTEGVIEYANPAFEDLSGFTDGAAIGTRLGRVQAEESVDVLDETFWQTMRDRTSWEGEIVATDAGGSRCVLDTTITAIHTAEGDLDGFVAVISDITERIEREQALQSRERELDLLRQILTRYLRHNLRNDLNVILGYADMLASRVPEEHTSQMESILATAERLMETGDNARLYSSLIDREDELTPHDLVEIVEYEAGDLSETYPGVDVELDCPDSCEILARPGISAAIEELFENAAEHNTAEAPWVRIRLDVTDRPRLVVEDNGPGIPEHNIAALEQGYETQLTHSSGIGLWLTKWVVEGIGGRLSFETSDGGTRVTVEFPPPDSRGSTEFDVPNLKAREQRLQTVIDRMTDAIVEVDTDWEITFLDSKAESILELDAATVTGRSLWDVFEMALGTEFETACRESMESRTTKTLEEHYGPTDSWLDIWAYPNFDGGISFYFRDVTDRKARQVELERARERTQMALENTNSLVFEIDPETGGVSRFGGYETYFARDREEVPTWEDHRDNVVHPEDREQFEDFYAGIVAGERSGGELVYRTNPDRGEVKWIHDIVNVEARGDGQDRRIVGLAQDVTEYKEYEQVLEREQSFIERALTELDHHFFVVDEDWTLREWNRHLPRATGHTDAELAGTPIADLVPREHHDRLCTAFVDSADGSERTVAAALLDADGEWLSCEFTIGRLTDAEGDPAGVACIAREQAPTASAR